MAHRLFRLAPESGGESKPRKVDVNKHERKLAFTWKSNASTNTSKQFQLFSLKLLAEEMQ